MTIVFFLVVGVLISRIGASTKTTVFYPAVYCNWSVLGICGSRVGVGEADGFLLPAPVPSQETPGVRKWGRQSDTEDPVFHQQKKRKFCRQVLFFVFVCAFSRPPCLRRTLRRFRNQIRLPTSEKVKHNSKRPVRLQRPLTSATEVRPLPTSCPLSSRPRRAQFPSADTHLRLLPTHLRAPTTVPTPPEYRVFLHSPRVRRPSVFLRSTQF